MGGKAPQTPLARLSPPPEVLREKSRICLSMSPFVPFWAASAKTPAAPLRKKSTLGPRSRQISRLSDFPASFHVSIYALLRPHRPKRPPRRSEKSTFWAPISRQNSRASDFPAFSMSPFYVSFYAPLGPHRPTRPPRRSKRSPLLGPHFPQKNPMSPIFPPFHVSFYALWGPHRTKRPPRRSKQSALWAPIPAKIPAGPIFPPFHVSFCPLVAEAPSRRSKKEDALEPPPPQKAIARANIADPTFPRLILAHF